MIESREKERMKEEKGDRTKKQSAKKRQGQRHGKKGC